MIRISHENERLRNGLDHCSLFLNIKIESIHSIHLTYKADM
jgi:hypothetical protein